jgi:pimeloyl-ACP methyl ester carboxylesterase
MKKIKPIFGKFSQPGFVTLALLITFLLNLAGTNQASAQYFKIDYPASAVPEELQLAVTYTLWVPPGVKTIRGIVVHQHGAGTIAAKSGENAAYDLHWQALAKKWDCALLTPSYHVLTEKTDASPGGAEQWFDPRRGSDKTFLKAIDEFAAKTGHPELSVVPWVLWGHSGGAIWGDMMTMLHPDRVAVLWLRSGAANMRTNWKDFAEYKMPEAAYAVPTICNPGIQEIKGIGASQMIKFDEYRAKGAPMCFAFDPLTAHWTGNSRYLAIPFLDACIALRFPDKGSKSQTLKPINMSKSLFAPMDGSKPAVTKAAYKDDLKKAVWLPNALIAKEWQEFIKTGGVSDSTPPPAPFDVKVTDKGTQGSEITWDAEADFESGIRNFIVLRDGQELGNLPAINQVRFQVRPMFQAGWTESYNDAPAHIIPEMKFTDPWPKDNKPHIYTVVTVNTVGLRSKPSEPVTTEVSK